MFNDENERQDRPCAEEIDLPLIADGEVDGARLELFHHHVGACDRCRARLRELQDEKQFLHRLLGQEDDTEAGLSRSAVARVEAALDRFAGSRRRARGRRFFRRIGAGLAAAAAIGAFVVWHLGTSDLTAAPGRILDAAYVAEKAWLYQSGKVLHWTVESDISGSPRLPDGHYRTLHWVSNVPGAEGSVLRKFDSAGRLVFATSRRLDGSYVSYDVKRRNPLRIEPSPADLRAALPALPPDERRVLEAVLKSREPARELSARCNRFAESLVQAVNARGHATARQIRGPDGRDAYYIRAEYGAGARLDAGVTRLVMETYMDAATFNRYRLRSQRFLTDGGTWIEDARWTSFRETTLDEFEAQSLNDLLGRMPAVALTAKDIARTTAETATGR